MSRRTSDVRDGGRRSETAFRVLLESAGLGVTVLLAAILLSLVLASRPALVRNGLGFLTGTTWDPVADVYGALPFLVGTLREAALSLGATRSETVRRVALPYAMSGILGGMLLALGRALGETMAVTMLIGNSPALTLNLLAPGSTMASVIANEFTEAVGETYLASLVQIGLLLFATSTALNLGGRLVIARRMARAMSA